MALFCSHTKAAAFTAVERWGKKSGRLDISTIHSHCFRALGLSMAQTVDDAKLKFFVGQFGMDTEEGSDANKYFEIIDYDRICQFWPVLVIVIGLKMIADYFSRKST